MNKYLKARQEFIQSQIDKHQAEIDNGNNSEDERKWLFHWQGRLTEVNDALTSLNS